MRIKDMVCYIRREELVNIIDKENKTWSKKKLLDIICNYEKFSVAQYQWILSNLKYIFKYSKNYSKYVCKIVSFKLEEDKLVSRHYTNMGLS
jgi:hypothetical protein